MPTRVLAATAPFDFRHTLRIASGFRPFEQEQLVSEGALYRAFSVGGQAVGVRMSAADAGVQVDFHTSTPSEQALIDGAAQRVRRMLSLDDDLAPLYAAAQDDAAFAPAIKHLYGYHQVRFSTPFEAACWAILTQRTNRRGAWQMKHTLTRTFGPSVTIEGQAFQAFPEPVRLLEAGDEAVGAAVRHVQKTPWVLNVTRAFAMMDDEWLYSAPTAAVVEWLSSIEGIGPWSVGFILLRGLGRMERLPVGEKALLAAASERYGTQTEASLRRLAARYDPLQGYWAHYLRVAG